MSKSAIIDGILESQTVAGNGRKLRARLESAGFVQSYGPFQPVLNGPPGFSVLVQPGAPPDGADGRVTDFWVTDSRRVFVLYTDEEGLLRDLRLRRSSMEAGRWHAWYKIRREEAYRLWREATGLTEFRNGHVLQDGSPRDLGVEPEVAAATTDDEILAIVRRSVNQETVRSLLKVYVAGSAQLEQW